jgi:predicted site-specific integrase-resolvase
MSTGTTLGYAEVAELAGVSVASVRAYKHDGKIPAPDASLTEDRPRWRVETITAWLQARPGKGTPGKARGPRSPKP